MNKELIDEISEILHNLEYSDFINAYYAETSKEIVKLCSKAACEAVEESDYHFIVGEDMRPFVDAYKVINAIKQALEGSDE